MASYKWPPAASSTGVPIYPDFASFPSGSTAGDLAVAADTGILYEWSGSAWQVIGGPGVALSIGAFGSSPNNNGLLITATTLVMEPADATHPGGVSTAAQTLAGAKTFSTAPILSSLSASLPLQLDASKNITAVAIDLSGTQATGILAAARFPALTGDITTASGALATTLATVNSNVGSFTYSAITVNAKGLVTAAANGSTGTLSDVGTDGIIVTGGSGCLLSNASLAQHVADTTHNGYLSSTDWNTFNGKQASGSYITALTGDVTASGPGSAAATAAATQNNITSIPNLATVGTVTSGTWSATTIALNKGGTGQTTKAAAFDALQPMTTGGDIIYGGASGTGTRLANGTSGQVLQSSGTTVAPTWATLTAPTQQKFTATGTTTGYWFTVTSANATVAATYTNNTNTFTVLTTISSGTRLFCSGASAPQSSGTLTKATGTGDSTITFSAAVPLATYTTPAGCKAISIKGVGGGGGGGGMATAATSGGGGGGGGAGSTFTKFIASPAGSYFYSVGAGGAGGSSGANDGIAGVLTSFNTTVLAGGGAGGRGSTASLNTIYMGTGGQGAGGVASGGDENMQGGAGGWGLVLALNNAVGGQGGNSSSGGGGASRIDAGTGNAGGTYGGGGSGGVVVSASASVAGGGAADGLLEINEFYQ